MIHELKTWIPYFDDIVSGEKTFEFRKNDRDFKIGDKLKLMEYDQNLKKLTGQCIYKEIIYILDLSQFGFENYIIMSI